MDGHNRGGKFKSCDSTDGLDIDKFLNHHTSNAIECFKPNGSPALELLASMVPSIGKLPTPGFNARNRCNCIAKAYADGKLSTCDGKDMVDPVIETQQVVKVLIECVKWFYPMLKL